MAHTMGIDTSKYDDMPISVFIYEPVYEDGFLTDYRVVYGNEEFVKDWKRLHPDIPFEGAYLVENHILNEEAYRMMEKLQKDEAIDFSTYMEKGDMHVHFQPMKNLDEPYGGFFLTNVTEYEESSARAHFMRSIRQMGGAASLIRLEDDDTLTPLYVSDELAQMMECSVDEGKEYISGLGFIRSTHPDDRLAVKRILRRRISDDGGTKLVIRKITTKGNTIWCQINYAFIDDFHDHYLYCTYNDVTAAKEYERRLRTAYMAMGDSFYRAGEKTLGMFRVNLSKDRIEDIQGKDIFGTDSIIRSYTEVMKLREVNYPIPADKERLRTIFSPVSMEKDYLEGTMELTERFFSRRRNGRFCYVNLTAAMTRHPLTGEVVAFITEEEANDKQVESTLLEKILARQFDMVAYLTNGRYGVIVGDESLIGAGSIFPLKRNGDYQDYLEDQVYPVLMGEDEEVSAMTKALSWESIRKNTDIEKPYVINISCDIGNDIYYKRLDFYAIDKDAEFYILLKSDTTKIQREQKKQNDRLKEALEAAEQASVAKTAFLSQMSHEIRTPMNAIIGLDNIALQEPDLSDNMRGYLEKIGMSGRHLLSLINDILDMSRIESGRMSLKKEEFSFQAFLDQVNTIVDSQCRDKGLIYDCAIHGLVGERYIGDNTKLKQVLINILGNAVKFTDEGGTVSLNVESTAHFDNQTTMQFKISDTGIGMDKEYLPKIFEAFSQEDDTTTNKYGGSGLGLAITKNIVEMMNGTVTVESEKGVGTTFTVTVTLKDVETKPGDRDVDIDPSELSVLVIDDDEIACQHAKIVLEEIGIVADTAIDPDQAIEMVRVRHARHDAYNLMLIDLKMPDKDGVEVTKEIREILGDDSTAIIILTAYNWDDIEDDAISAGVDSFMSKPLFASNVITELKDVMTRKGSVFADEQIELAKLEGRRILLAEDMEINAEIMKQILGMRDMVADHAENGQIALDLFGESKPGTYDAILMDVRMPVMDGLKATEAIRASDHPDAKKVPIIAMTANAFDEDVQRSLQAGMNAHLAKPVEPDNLYQTLAELIARHIDKAPENPEGGAAKTGS